MLFTVGDNDYMLDNYFNLSNNIGKDSSDVLSPKEGLILGNMFLNEYNQYKNYKPNELKVRNEQEKELLKIRELSFAINDLSLMLDIYPNSYEYFNLFKTYTIKLNECMKKYAEKYTPLELNYDFGNNYSWQNNPWPWEGDNNV